VSTVATRLEAALDRATLAEHTDPHDERTWPLVAPASDDEWRAFVDLAAREGWSVLPLGRGTKLGWTRTARHVDVVCSTRRTTGVVAHEPTDGTLTVRAGTTLGALEEAVHAGGHALVPDVPRSGSGARDEPTPDEPTIGGVVASAHSGWDRLRHGPVRDQVLGSRLLLGDGTIARSGGRLVKNVTGYDLHRLHTGSFGTLGVLLDISLRLTPRPERTSWHEARAGSAAQAFVLAGRLRSLPLSATAIALRGDEHGWRVGVHLAGGARTLAAEAKGVDDALGPDAVTTDGPTALERIEFWRESERDGGWPDLFVTTRPSSCESVLARARASAAEHGLTLRALAHPALATLALHACGDDDARDDWLTSFVPALRAEIEPRGGRAFLRRASPRVQRELEPFGEPPGLDLMRTLRERFDPTSRFAAGRLHREL